MTGSTLHMLRAQVLVEQRIFWRNVSTMFFTFVLPIVLLGMVAFGSDDSDALAVVVALAILSTSFQGLAMQLSMHRDQGVLKGIMATPMPPLVFIAAKVLSLLLVVALEMAIILAVGIAATDARAPEQPLLLALLVVLGTVTFAAIGFAVAGMIPSSDAAPAIVNGAYVGLALLSFAVAEVDSLPAIARDIGTLLPLNQLVTSIHDTWLGGDNDAWLSVLVLVAWAAAAIAWTVRYFRWEPRELPT